MNIRFFKGCGLLTLSKYPESFSDTYLCIWVMMNIAKVYHIFFGTILIRFL